MIRFYYASGSPWAWRVHMALEEKGIPYEASLLSFGAGDLKTSEYLAINPHGKVPALTDGDVVLYESQAILEYVEDKYPAKPLLPADAAARGGDFLMGAQLTRADTSWIPFVEIAGRAGVALEVDSTPWLAAWRDRMRERTSYQKSYPPHWRK